MKRRVLLVDDSAAFRGLLSWYLHTLPGIEVVAEGKSTKEVAQILDVSAKTVETHRGQIMERLGIHDLAGLVRYAIRTGLVSPDR